MNTHQTRMMSASDLLPRWLRAPLLPVVLGKELQAVMPFWFVALAAAGIVAVGNNEIQGIGLVVLLLAHSAVGAMSIGHEFNCRTIGLVMSQPIDRSTLWQRKRRVVAMAIAAATVPVLVRPWIDESAEDAATVIAAAIGAGLCGLCVAPGLTLATRSALAGTVFTSALPLLLLMAANVITAALPWGLVSPADPTRSTLGIFFALLAVHWLVGVWAGRRCFLQFDASEAVGEDLSARRWVWFSMVSSRSQAGARTCGSWRRRWVGKELRLQQTSLIVAGLFLIAWILFVGAHWIWPSVQLAALGLLQPVFTSFIALLVGALACAEERHHGTLDAQLILPVATHRQWWLKSGISHALALGLAVLLPATLRILTPAGEDGLVTFELGWVDWFLVMTPMTILFTSVALYASSVSRSTVRALLTSVLISMGLAGLLSVLLREEGLQQTLVNWQGSVPWVDWLPQRLAVVILVCLAGGALTLLAARNYRTLDQRLGRVLLHVGGVSAGSLLLFAAYVSGGMALARRGASELETAAVTAPAELPPQGRLLAPAEFEAAGRFQSEDVIDWPGLVNRLREPKDSVSAHVTESWPAATREALRGWRDADPVPEGLRTAVVDGLNELVRGPLLFTAARFAGVRLRLGLRDWVQPEPLPPARAVVNRMLLEDAFPAQLARRPLELRIAPGQGVPTNRAALMEVREMKSPPQASGRWIMGMTNGVPGRPAIRMDIRTMKRYGLLPSTQGRGEATNNSAAGAMSPASTNAPPR